MSSNKSVRQQIMDGTTEVNHKNLNEEVRLPAWLTACKDYLDSESDLTKILSNHGVLLGVLHKGLDNCLQTGIRAVARKDTGKSGGYEPYIDSEAAENYKPSPLPKQEEKEVKSAKSQVQKLKEKGWSKEEIAEYLGL